LGVDVVGVSSLAAGHKALIPEIVELLKVNGGQHIIVVAGGVIPEKDYDFLREAGVAEVFGPGTNVIDAANSVLGQVQGLRRNIK
ncbi:MAG: cobalamin-dependent protein, partial [Rhodobacterales bacterium]